MESRSSFPMALPWADADDDVDVDADADATMLVPQ